MALYDTGDPFGPALRSVQTIGFIVGPATAVPSTALKLVLIDQPGTMPDKMVFKSLDPHITAPCDVDAMGVDVSVAYDATAGSFTVPPGAYDGVAGWSNRFKPGGGVPSAVGSRGPFQARRAGRRRRSDRPAPCRGALGSRERRHSPDERRMAGDARTEFAACTYAPLASGTGAKLKCSGGTPAATCVPIE